MVTPRHKQLFLDDWMEEFGISDEQLADEVGHNRVTVTRWRNEKRNLTPEKLRRVAEALGRLANRPTFSAEQLLHSPKRPSIDAMLKGAPDELVQRAAEVTAILLKSAQ